MADTPFFTVIIPTKNRPYLLRDAITSVLEQDFTDIELVVSDNQNGVETQQTIASFDDPRLRHVKPEQELNMPDHWEFATQHARGTYTMILTDRSVLNQGALTYIHDVLQKNDPIDICWWQFSNFDEVRGVFRNRNETDGGIEILSPQETGRRFLQQPRAFELLPRPMNACYRQSLAEKIREQHGRLCPPLFPDNTSAHLLIGYASRLAYIKKALYTSQGGRVSTGRKFGFQSPYPYLDSLGVSREEWTSRVPIDAPLTINLMYQDFLEMRARAADSHLSDIDVDWSVYFVECYRDIKKKERKGFDNKELNQYKKAWQTALENQPASLKKEVSDILTTEHTSKPQTTGRKSSIRNLLRPVRKSIRRVLPPRRQYATVLEAAGFVHRS